MLKTVSKPVGAACNVKTLKISLYVRGDPFSKSQVLADVHRRIGEVYEKKSTNDRWKTVATFQQRSHKLFVMKNEPVFG